MGKALKVLLHSTEPKAVEATRNTIESLGSDRMSFTLLEVKGSFFLLGTDLTYAKFVVERQGYVKQVVGEVDLELV